MMDTFAKYDSMLSASVLKNEALYFQTCKELQKADGELKIESSRRGPGNKEKTVEEYIQNFTWDGVKFQMDKNLVVLGAKILSDQKAADERLNKTLEEQNEVKNKLGQLLKKPAQSFLQKDLGDLVYEQKIDKKYFVNTYGQDTIMTTLLVVVNQKKKDIFEESYLGLLINFNETDFESWQKKTRTNILH